MPLPMMNVKKKDVTRFWAKQGWDLNLPDNGALSNCVFCFLKGARNLGRVHDTLRNQSTWNLKGYGAAEGTPCDINWWKDKEQKYGRDLKVEKRDRTNPDGGDFIGFFGASSGFSYELLSNSTTDIDGLEQYADTVLPCDCTE